MTNLSEIMAFLSEKGAVLLQTRTNSPDVSISGPRNGNDAQETQFTFFNEKAGDEVYSKIANSKAALIIVDTILDQNRFQLPHQAVVYQSIDAKKTMMMVAQHFFISPRIASIHPTSQIDESAKIGKNTHVSAGVVIEANVEIGSDCILEPHVYIQSNTKIGNRVHIKANAVIGGNGFGYVKNETDSYQHVPHFGRVIIEDDVHIGSNSCIDRGSLSDTHIQKGVKIDNLVHIAHNVNIGENSLIIACSMIAGSVQIGKNCWIAPAASIKNGITIGDNVTVGMSSLVLKPVESGKTIAGVPAKELK